MTLSFTETRSAAGIAKFTDPDGSVKIMVVGGKYQYRKYRTSSEVYDLGTNTWTLIDAQLPYTTFETTAHGSLSFIQNPLQGTRIFLVGYQSYVSTLDITVLELSQDFKTWTELLTYDNQLGMHPLSFVVAYNYN